VTVTQSHSSRVRRRRAVALAVTTGTALVSCGAARAYHAQAVTPLVSPAPRALAGRAQAGSAGSARPSGPAAVYAHTGVGDFAPATRNVPYRLYVPESAGTGVDVIDPAHMTVIGHYKTGLDPQHVVPSYDLQMLWSTNDLANTVTPFDPRTGRPKGPTVAVDDPYNMYFAPGGRLAIVVAEQRQQLEFEDAHTMAPVSVTHVNCPGLDHADFDASERFMVASCELSHRLVRIELATRTVNGYLDLPGSSPQDVRLTPDGSAFVVADKDRGGVHLIDAEHFTETGFLPTGPDAHGIYPSRDAKTMYVSNRGNGTISVIDPAAGRVLTTWRLPMGGSPDMGGVSPDGTALWLSGRYDATIYKISTRDGHLLGQVHVPHKPHGMCVWPQPGRYSLGHTGNLR